jgi:putative nucleotidyltransferase with HDIG domain
LRAYTPSGGVINSPRTQILGLSVRFPDEAWLPLYAACLSIMAVAAASSLAWAGYRPTPAAAVLPLAVLAAIAERSRVRLAANLELSISLLPSLFAAVAFGPMAAMIVGAASMIGDGLVLRSAPYPRAELRWLIYTSIEALTGAATGIVATTILSAVPADYAGVALATVVGAATSQTLDTAFAVLTGFVRRSGRPAELVRALLPVTAASVPLYAPLVALLVITYRQVSPWTLPLFLVPTLAAQRLYALYQEQRRLTDDVVGANARLERANLSFATALVATLDARDRYTAGHSAAVAIYARDIAGRMGLSEELQRLVHLCGLVHDVGKIGLPAGLLEKPGALSLDERRQMEQHSVIGERILKKVDDYGEIAAIVRHHHERVDGLGYPDRLVGDEIPLLSRIIAVADAYNAMTSDRPYRDAMPSRVARLRLAQAVDSHFDTAVVAAFEAILASSEESYRMGMGEGFMLTEPQSHPAARPLAAVLGS